MIAKNKLTIIGLGVKPNDLSLGALDIIKTADFMLLRTEKTPSSSVIKDLGIKYTSLDSYYEGTRSFSLLTKKLVSAVKKQLKEGSVCYLVDGAVSEDLCAKTLINEVKNVDVWEGVSKVGNALSVLKIPTDYYTSVSAYNIDEFERYSFPLVIYDLDSRILASEWKLKLASIIGEEELVSLYIDKRAKTIRLYELDFEDGFDYSTVLAIRSLPLKDKTRFDFYDLMEILRILRSPNGCPWDRAQSPLTIKKNLIEEAYELIDAIDLDDDDKMKEETGDIMLQVGFHILFAEERGAYSAQDVISGVCDKLIKRHTHVFGNDKAAGAEDALTVWDKNKQVEKGYTSAYNYVNDVPQCFPALLRTEKVVKRAIGRHFDVFSVSELQDKICDLVKKDLSDAKVGGAVLFFLTYLIKKAGASPEEDLAAATKAFIAKLGLVEEKLSADGKTFADLSPEEIKRLYDEA